MFTNKKRNLTRANFVKGIPLGQSDSGIDKKMTLVSHVDKHNTIDSKEKLVLLVSSVHDQPLKGKKGNQDITCSDKAKGRAETFDLKCVYLSCSP